MGLVRSAGATTPISWDRLPVWWRENALAILVAFGAALIAYSSIVTQFLFTNHSVPNIFIYPYPSFKTFYEGRWFADIIIRLGGGGGTQSFQALAGFFFQALNGVLFAEVLRVKGRANRILIALLVALHPAVLDYYAFTIDNASFTIGDSLLLLGAIALDRGQNRLVSWTAATILFVLALATYQPKIAVLAVILIAWVVSRTTSGHRDDKNIYAPMVAAAVCFVLAVILYRLSLFITTDLATDTGIGQRTHMNSLREVAVEFFVSYQTVIVSSIRQIKSQPLLTGWATIPIVLGGTTVAATRAARRSPLAVLLSLIGIAVLPPAINLAAVINNESWTNTGRISIGYVYALPFFVAVLMTGAWQQRIARLLAIIVIYGFFLVATQQNQYMSTKALFETNLLSRITGRIESILPDDKPHPLVVLGYPSFDDGALTMMYPDRPLRSQFNTAAFAPYRQPAIVNFFLGRSQLRFATADEIALATSHASGRPAWPLAGSVYMDGDMVVVVLTPVP
ncbi:glucosyltransferase domain-containing protein [Kaistia dalseonensis]|uniref:Glycosyltransferase RgtA/B/C/D-like domain-containing protein n=1 Tax=Kaistia dalseonensis TaxID=410840 RepID=A0ABU0HCL2_9HYPH|nr:glucosyltransferase domain-containing protein [Kaistia dalseonensis]MCX5496977.1 glucosyltransferase domain-containing protein [Kaistia dalseonensis]MDQ0439603.1 hypothetical protein [Kaistia dalseonensis]